MSRTLWKGSLSFGLITIPIRLYSATSDKSVSFRQLRAGDHSRVRSKRVAQADGEEVAYDELVKGYELDEDRYAVFTKDELDALKPESSRTVEIHQFVPLDQIDPVYFQRSYYVAPDEAGAKAYGLLTRAMAKNDSVALCKIMLRDKEHLATLRLRDGVLVMATMYWPDEIQPASLADLGVDQLPEPRDQEVQMAESLIQNYTQDFDPGEYQDVYRQRVMEAVQAKAAGEEVAVTEPAEESAQVVDLMDALTQSVEASKQRRGSGDGQAGEDTATTEHADAQRTGKEAS
jgi:DNA end-binding protein Ku